MLPFTVFVALLIFAFGLCMFVLHSTHPKDVEGSFGTLQEALFTTVSAWLVARTTRVFNRAHILTFHRRPLYPMALFPPLFSCCQYLLALFGEADSTLDRGHFSWRLPVGRAGCMHGSVLHRPFS
jgi:hypothetical protein